MSDIEAVIQQFGMECLRVNADSPVEQQQAAIRQYGQFIVAIGVFYSRTSNPQPQLGSCSGFIVDLGGKWNLVTAGHFIRELEAEGTVIERAFLLDTFGTQPKHAMPIPFNPIEAVRIPIVEEDFGVDFALIVIPNLIRSNLEANGIKALTSGFWQGIDRLDFHSHFIVAFPEEFLTETLPSGKSYWSPNAVVIPITKQAIPPSGYETKLERFVGCIPEHVALASVSGMSGGPIFGIGRDDKGRDHPRLIAIQSSWLASKRIVFGCPMLTAVRLIKGILTLTIEKDR